MAKLTTIRTLSRRYPIPAAFVASLLIHASLYGSWLAGKHLGLWNHQASWFLSLLSKKSPPSQRANLAPAPPDAPKPIPVTFAEVDPDSAAQTPPEETKYYGALSSLASNPEASLQEKDKPKIDGSQDKVVRLADNPRPIPFPLQPSPPPEPETPSTPQPEKPEARPDQPEPKPPGDLAKASPLELPKSGETAQRLTVPPAPPKPQDRPRKLAEVRPQNMALAGQTMVQDGGVPRRGRVALNVKATPFGAYDLAFIRAVEQRWYTLLDTTSFVQRSGKVVLEFKLHSDGRVTELKAQTNEVGEILGLLCQRAIVDPAPYAPWPSDMRRMIGDNVREVTFTFYYY